MNMREIFKVFKPFEIIRLQQMLSSSANKIFLVSCNILLHICFGFSKCKHPANKMFLSLETYLYACVSECMKYKVYVFTVKLFTVTNTKISILACNSYQKMDIYIGLKLDKPVCDILKDTFIDIEVQMLSLLCSNIRPLLQLFLEKPKSLNLYAPFKNFFLFIPFLYKCNGRCDRSVSLDLNTNSMSVLRSPFFILSPLIKYKSNPVKSKVPP